MFQNSPGISRNGVTSLELNHVTGDNLSRGDGNVGAITNNTSRGRAQRPERVERLGSLELLPETNDDVEQDDGTDNGAFYPGFDTETGSHGQNQNLQRRKKKRMSNSYILTDGGISSRFQQKREGGFYKSHGVGNLRNKNLDGRDALALAKVIVAVLL